MVLNTSNVQENYFGIHQTPVSFDREPLRPDESFSLTDDDLIRLKSQTNRSSGEGHTDLSKIDKLPEKRIIDPRDFRPLSVRLSLEFHNIQVHLPMVGVYFHLARMFGLLSHLFLSSVNG